MKVLIVGLGVIGGSYAMGLKEKHEVYGIDKNIDTINKAKDQGYIIDGGDDPAKFLPFIDLVFLAIYPKMIIDFIKENRFKDGTIITDVAGVKESFIYKINEILPENVEFIGTHPMAGREKRGFDFADPNVFKGANFLITPIDNKEETIELIKDLAVSLGFKRITIMTPKYHDEVIAFTSQLTHAIAVSLVNSDNDPNTKFFTGDSYRDLTRIAQINENLWSELFLENKNNLLDKINQFEQSLEKLKKAIIDEDKDELCNLFIKSTIKRGEFNEKN